MLFSLLMANYNNSKYLDECIESVFRQTYTNWEIILVDDGSSDDFEEIIKKYKNDYRINILRNEKNKGCSYTKKRCIENASGILAAYLDPDDTIHPETLQIMIEAHTQRPACSIIHSTHYICDEKLNIIRIAEYPKALPHNTPYLLVNDGSVHAFAAFKKSCYDKTIGLSPIKRYDKAIDQELYYLLEEEGDIFFINKPLYYYRIHKGSISNLGNVKAATIAHYSIVEQACLRRIEKLKTSIQPNTNFWIKKYYTRYHKIRILNSFRKKNWMPFLSSLFIFPFIGGKENIISYCKKIPKQGLAILRKSFLEEYKIIE